MQVRQDDLVERMAGVLRDTGIEPARVELEITESMLLYDTAAALKVMRRLKGLGVRLSMDDFGTGYSSLSYLQSFPFDKIKIDGSFVRQLASNPDSMAIVRAVARLGSSLHMTTTAEGVETQEELEYLQREGCTEGQGYLFGKPQPARSVGALLARQGDKAVA